MKKLIIACLFLGLFATSAFAEIKTYTVKKGDTLSDIIVSLSLIGSKPKKIFELNPSLGMRLIHPGQKIRYYSSEIKDEIAILRSQINELGAKKTLEIIKSSSEEARQKLEKIEIDVNQGFKSINQEINRLSDRLSEKMIETREETIIFSVSVILLLMIVLFFVLKKMPSKDENEWCPITISGKKYFYSPKKKNNKYISLFRELEYEKAYDAARSSATAMKRSEILMNNEIKSGRLKEATS